MADDENLGDSLIIGKINKAKSGDTYAGRELLSMAARRLTDCVELGNELRNYIASALRDASQQPASNAARLLGIANKKNSSHRPPNDVRNLLALAAYEAAGESLSFSNDWEHKKLIQEREKIDSEPDKWERNAQLIDWTDEYHGEKKYTLERLQQYKTASAMFNHRLSEDQKNGYRMKEKPLEPGGIKSAIRRFRKS